MQEGQGTGDIRISEGDNRPPTALRFYDIPQISWSTFIFGPLAGCWFMSRNWVAFGDEGTAFRTLLAGAAGTMALLVGVQFLPDAVPHFIVPAAYTALVVGIAKTQQQARLDTLKAAGGQRASGWRVFGVGTLWLVLTLALFVAVVMLLQSAFPGFLPEPAAD